MLEVKIFNNILKNPIMPASGTFNSGAEINHIFYDISVLGAIVTKSVTKEPRDGNDHPRVANADFGMLNAIGLANEGIDNFIKKDLKFLETKSKNTKIIVSIAGHSISDFEYVIKKLNSYDFIMAYEINASCPNVKNGTSYMSNDKIFTELVNICKKSSKKPFIMKLSPEAYDIKKLSILAEKGGASAISLINTIPGTKINIYKRSPELGNKIGGFSGKGLKNISLRHVYEIYQLVNIPIIGIGGISNVYDVIEFLMAGATCVQIGTANFINPNIMDKIIKQLPDVMNELNVKNLSEIIGAANNK